EAFRSDELQVPPDAERQDQEMLVRLLQMLADFADAHEAVLWEPQEGTDGLLLAAGWSRGANPPALPEQERLLIDLAASEQRTTFNPTGPLRLMATGLPVAMGRGAVSVHFRELPALERTEVETRLRRFATEVTVRHELLTARANLARRTKRLRLLIRSAITLQGQRDPSEQEETVVEGSRLITGAQWCVLVRGNSEDGRLEIVRITDDTPSALMPGLSAKQQTIVGEVFKTGRPRLHTDTRALIHPDVQLFDATPLPSGTRSLIVVPVSRSENDPRIGVLLLGRTEREPFNLVDSGSAADLCTIAAGALETAWAWQAATLSAKTDQLTGLPNRRGFEEEFKRMIDETDRYGGESALVIVDVDHFKKVNDTYGHDAGDQVLKAVGGTLLAKKRATDKVARLGGEELAILLPQTDRVGAMEAAERCRKAIEALAVRTGVGDVRVTASFGVAMYGARSGGAGTLFDRADQALYGAKHGGRNRVVLASD
ncbi:MAG TPA: sensor domain-containing diguanylate cyclase, partial [Gemmatimonadaceae bacterium]|nr:sensor domain-containing diguanylate cyclase [Gemmatimonadaceae bacterium]